MNRERSVLSDRIEEPETRPIRYEEMVLLCADG
jgi:hypothetical protein